MPGLDAIFQVLGELLRLLLSWLPRFFLINVTERGVLFRRGQEPILLQPGFHWHCPLFSTYERYSLLKDPVKFSPTILPTRDGKPVAIGFVIVWHIAPHDVVAAATSTNDTEAMIGEIGESLLPPLVLQHSFEDLLERVRGGRNLRTVNESLTEESQSLLAEYGVTVDSARVNFLAPARVHRLLLGESHVPMSTQ